MPHHVRRVPLYGQISAGLPLNGLELIGSYHTRLPRRPRARFAAVRINGDSLIEAQIFDGQIAVIELTPELQFNGQLAAVLTPEGLTLKHCWFEGHLVRLLACNRRYRPQLWPVEEVTVQGFVVRIEKDL